MGLPAAMKSHKSGDLDEAINQYKRALSQGDTTPVIYQNLGALLRQKDQYGDALKIYQQGVKLYPHHIGIRRNRSNLLFATAPASAIQDLLVVIRLSVSSGNDPTTLIEEFANLITLTREMGMNYWCLSIIQAALRLVGLEAKILGHFLFLLEELDESLVLSLDLNKDELMIRLEKQISSCDPFQQVELYQALALHDVSKKHCSNALKRFDQSLEILQNYKSVDQSEIAKCQKLVDVNSWNLGCLLLKAENFQRGWKLFDYGLRTPAPGPQRWQRALTKPFSSSELPIWRGEPLCDKTLLLLEEQAIGDVMMFLTLIPTIAAEAKSLCIIVSDRLKPIYQRSFPPDIKILTMSDARNGDISYQHFDFQSPLGSICQYRFTTVDDYAPEYPILKSNPLRANQFRQSYSSPKDAHYQIKKLVGVSWKGGGRPGRIKEKSISEDLFAEILRSIPGVRFISLQYGNCSSQVGKWRENGIDIVHDSQVNPLVDMSHWLDQVASCDAVLSVANTTIHGAGGLNLPTMCLLGKKSDWRWIDSSNVARSYWYPSVGIFRQSDDLSWSDAIVSSRKWLISGCPSPSGPTSSIK